LLANRFARADTLRLVILLLVNGAKVCKSAGQSAEGGSVATKEGSMRRVVVAVATVFAVAAVFTGVAASSGDGGRLFAKGFACNVIDGDGDLFLTFNSEQWVYQDKQVLRCTGDGDPYLGPNPPFYWGNANWPPPGGGGLCNTFFGLTKDWSDKVGRKGNSQLVCITGGDPASASAPSTAGVG
jgi:hypothetical protein